MSAITTNSHQRTPSGMTARTRQAVTFSWVINVLMTAEFSQNIQFFALNIAHEMQICPEASSERFTFSLPDLTPKSSLQVH